MCFRVTLVIMILLYVGHSMWPDPLPGQQRDEMFAHHSHAPGSGSSNLSVLL